MLCHPSALINWGTRSKAIYQPELLLDQLAEGFGTVSLDPVPIDRLGWLAGREVSPDFPVDPVAWQHRRDDLSEASLPCYR